MRKFWVKSIPLLTILLVLTFGFTLIALANCSYLQQVCEDAKRYATYDCNTYGSGSNECNWAQSDAYAACDAYHNQCN